MRTETVGNKVEPKLPLGKDMTMLNKDVGPSKEPTMQDHDQIFVENDEKQFESQQKLVGKEDEAVIEEEDDFPELALLPKEWTY
jgi:hypothetical protein